MSHMTPSEKKSAFEVLENLSKHGHGIFNSAKSYNERTGGCNIILANHLISLLKPHLPPLSSPLRIHDNACGPLVQTTQLLADPELTAHPLIHISATDTSPEFISSNKDFLSSTPSWNNGNKKVDTAVMNGMELQFPDLEFDVSFTSLAIFAFPDPVKGVQEVLRTLKPGGVAAFTTWKHCGWFPLLHIAESRLRPNQPLTQFPFLDAWSPAGRLSSLLKEGGFQRVEEKEVRSLALFESVGEAARCVSETLKMMVWGRWSEGEREGMRGELERVFAGEGVEGCGDGDVDGEEGGGKGGVVRGENGEVGFEMVAWAGVGWKGNGGE